MDFFYLHIPKTAGSFFNQFLHTNIESFLEHIEVKIDLENETDILKLSQYQSFSGHVVLPRVQNKFLHRFPKKVITILRNPIEQLISHITFVRELAEESEKNRFVNHSRVIQELALYLKSLDFTNPNEFIKLIDWLEKNEVWLFHDCQTRYLGNGKGAIQPDNLDLALKNLESIEYIGISERLQEFMVLLAHKESLKVIESTKVNATKRRYGLDINNEATVRALYPLIKNDKIVYRIARQRFIKDLHELMSQLEIAQVPRYSTVKIDMLYNELYKNSK